MSCNTGKEKYEKSLFLYMLMRERKKREMEGVKLARGKKC